MVWVFLARHVYFDATPLNLSCILDKKVSIFGHSRVSLVGWWYNGSSLKEVALCVTDLHTDIYIYIRRFHAILIFLAQEERGKMLHLIRNVLCFRNSGHTEGVKPSSTTGVVGMNGNSSQHTFHIRSPRVRILFEQKQFRCFQTRSSVYHCLDMTRMTTIYKDISIYALTT